MKSTKIAVNNNRSASILPERGWDVILCEELQALGNCAPAHTKRSLVIWDIPLQMSGIDVYIELIRNAANALDEHGVLVLVQAGFPTQSILKERDYSQLHFDVFSFVAQKEGFQEFLLGEPVKKFRTDQVGHILIANKSRNSEFLRDITNLKFREQNTSQNTSIDRKEQEAHSDDIYHQMRQVNQQIEFISSKYASIEKRLSKTERRILKLRWHAGVLFIITWPIATAAKSIWKIIRRKHRGDNSNTDLGNEKYIGITNYRKIPPHPSLLTNSRIHLAILKLDHIGDLVLSLPAIQVFRDSWPDCHITIICSTANKSLAEAMGAFDAILTFDFAAPLADQQKTAKKVNPRDIRKILPEAPFDVAVDLRHDPDTRPVLAQINAKFRAGFEAPALGDLFLDLSLPSVEGKNIINPLHNVSRLRLLSLAVVNELKQVDWAKMSTMAASRKISAPFDGMPFAAIIPGAGSLAKMWPIECHVSLAKRLHDEFGLKILVVGGKREKVYAEEICRNVPKEAGIDTTANLPLTDVAGLLFQATIVIGCDTGPTHIAATLGVPTICLFSGVADHRIWAPMGRFVTLIQHRTSCTPCAIDRLEACGHQHACMKGISVDDVVAAVREKLTEVSEHKRNAFDMALNNK